MSIVKRVAAGLILTGLGCLAGEPYTQAQQPMYAQLPPLPVSIEYRRALIGPGLVLKFYNNSGRPLQLLVILTHPSINVTERFALAIGPNRHVDIGKLNGWIAQPGDQIVLHNVHYLTLRSSIP